MLIVDIDTLGVPAVSTKTSVSCTSGTMYLLSNNKKMVCEFSGTVSVNTNIDF